MLVSIITPSYNSLDYIAETINSVLEQSYSNWELIIIDDCSTDKSPEIIRQFSQLDTRIKLYQLTKNVGIAGARNAGLEIAKGDYIAFLDSDDLWDKGKLEKQIHFMSENQCTFCHTAYRKIDSKGAIISSKIPVSYSVGYYDLLRHNEIGCLTAIYNAKILGKYFFPEIGHEDFANWLKILKNNNRSFGLNEVLASYRVHNESVSSNKLKAIGFTWTIFRKQEKLGLIKAVYFFLSYAFNSSIKLLKK